MIRPLITLVLALVLGACSTSPKQSEAEVGPRLSQTSYVDLVQKYTVSDKQYDGFYAKFEVYATLLNTEVQTAVLQKTSDTLQWSALTAQKEREKLFQENSNSTKVFLSFFTPTRRINDLAKGNTIWKVYLESNGEKYEGKITKRTGAYEALVMMFPHHSRWAIAYDVSFSVPLSAVEKNESYFIITSSVGSTRMKFSAVSGASDPLAH